jgi:TRAP-type C4-dicarboxylate transport system substrate-binding protein
MAFGEVYTSLQTGVIDGYEHDASTTLQQHFYEVARYMTRTSHIAGVLGLSSSTVSLSRFTPDVRAMLGDAAREAAARQRAVGPREEEAARRALESNGMTIRDLDRSGFERSAVPLWEEQARTLGVTAWLETIRL